MEKEEKEIKYSYSKLECYESCGFKYKLQYIDGHNCFNANVATAFGGAIHKAEEDIAKYIIAGQPIDYATVKNNLILKLLDVEHIYQKDYLEKDAKSNRTYKEKAYHYLEHEIYNLEKFMAEHPTYEIVGVEQNFLFNLDADHRFRGAIDRAFHDKATDQYLIQDIKTWAVEKDEKELATPLQFVVYVLAAKELWGATPDKIKCQYYLPLVNGGITQDGGTTGFMDRGIKKIEKLFDSIESSDWTPKQSPLCAFCGFSNTNQNATEPYKHMCPYHSKWTREKKDFSKENEWQGIENHQLILEAYHKKYNII